MEVHGAKHIHKVLSSYIEVISQKEKDAIINAKMIEEKQIRNDEQKKKRDISIKKIKQIYIMADFAFILSDVFSSTIIFVVYMYHGAAIFECVILPVILFFIGLSCLMVGKRIANKMFTLYAEPKILYILGEITKILFGMTSVLLLWMIIARFFSI